MITEFNSIVAPLNYYSRDLTLGFITKTGTKSKVNEDLKKIAKKMNIDESVLQCNVFRNEPVKGVRIVPTNLYIKYLGSLSYKLEDPRGFSLNVPAYAIGKIIENCTITNGYINEEIMYDIPYKYIQPKILVRVNGIWS